MEYVTRAEWGAREPDRATALGKGKAAVVHHSATEVFGAAACRQHQRYHMDARGYADIAYSWLVDTDGTIYEGRGWGVLSAATGGFNTASYACMAMGNYDTRRPTDALLEGFAAVWKDGIEKGWIATPLALSGHRDHGTSSCPGRYLYPELDRIRQLTLAPIPSTLLRRGDRSDAVTDLQRRLVELGYDLAIGGYFGPDTESAVRMFQADAKIEVDGVVGPVTLDALTAAEAAPKWPPPRPHFKVAVVVNDGRDLAPATVYAKADALKLFVRPVPTDVTIGTAILVGEAATDRELPAALDRYNATHSTVTIGGADPVDTAVKLGLARKAGYRALPGVDY